MRSGKKEYLYLIPALAVLVIFIFYPIVRSFWISFHVWNGVDPTMKYVGLQNFKDLLFNDEVFKLAVRNVIIWTGLAILIPVTIGLVLAVCLSRISLNIRIVFMTLIALPMVLSIVAVGMSWQFIYHPAWGMLNLLLRKIGLASYTRAWLGESRLALFAVNFAADWHYIPYPFLLYYSGLQVIPQQLYEAAEIDGASSWQAFWHITLPMLKRTTTIVLIITIIGSLKVFDAVWIMTWGGPAHATEVLATYVYDEAFRLYGMGYGAAIAVVLFFLVMFITSGYIFVIAKERTRT